MPLEHQGPPFVPFRCRCGRSLRAKRDQVGTEVRCWDCHEMVLVPMPDLGPLVAREMKGQLRDVFQGTTLPRTVAAAAIVAAAMSIPVVGLGVAGFCLVLVASVYGATIRRGDAAPIGSATSWRAVPHPRSLVEALGCILLVAGMAGPLWVRNASPGSSPHLDPAGLAILASTGLLLPILLVMIHSRGEDEASGLRRFRLIFRRHSWAFLSSILVVPLGLMLTEACLDLFFYLQGWLPFFALENMPIPGQPVISHGVPLYDGRDFRILPQGAFIKGYFDGVLRGYSFLGSIPASLSLPTRAGLNPRIISLLPYSYTMARFAIVVFLVTGVLTTFLVQARWLGLLSTLDQPARPVATDQLPRPL